MPVTVRIPTQLRTLTANAAEVVADGCTVGEVLHALEQSFPGFHDRLFDDDGRVRRFVNIFVVDEDVRFNQGLATPVTDGHVISILPAVAGGCDNRTFWRASQSPEKGWR